MPRWRNAQAAAKVFARLIAHLEYRGWPRDSRDKGELVALPAWFRLDQGWLSVFGLLLDALGFGLIAFEW